MTKRNENDKSRKEIDDYLAQFDKVTDKFKEKVSDIVDEGKSPIRDSGKAPQTKPALSDSSTTGPSTKGRGKGKINSKGGRGRYKLNKKKTLKLAASVVIAICFFLAFYSFTVIANAPKIDAGNIYSYLSESSVLYDDKGKAIDNVFVEEGNRINVEYEQMPEDLINAIVAIEDKTFWKHHGFNVIRIFGAIKDSIFSGDGISGTSTITQQLARNVYLSETKQVRSLSRKVTEAYYSVLIEASLSKEEIVEAYLNTIYLGYNCYGVQSASQTYFSKDVKDLNLLECASLAAIPRSPDTYALLKHIQKGDAKEGSAIKEEDILRETTDYILAYNGDVSKERREATLDFMEEQGYITASQNNKAKSKDLRSEIDPAMDSLTGLSAYFCDYTLSEVVGDLMDEYNYSESEARQMLYQGGLKIYTCMDSNAQEAIEKEFQNSANFPSVVNLSKDSQGNILDKWGNPLLYAYSNYINSNDDFVLKNSEYKTKENGDMLLLEGKRLNFYKTSVDGNTDYSVEFKPMYLVEDGVFYSIENGVLLIPAKYKKSDKEGNLIISAGFFKDYPAFFNKSGSDYIVKRSNYSLKQQVQQPQGAMVITDYKKGEVKAMAGGRNTSGRQLYNRAVSPRQPGSSIKPLSVYSSALQQGADAAEKGTPMTFNEYDKNQKTEYYGKYWTAASGINDEALVVGGRVWPKNWYSGYKGMMTLRESVQQSVNVNAVRVFQQIGADYAVKQLKNFGVTTVVDDASEATNDLNAAALALGGMSKGISPMEMSSAFGTFPNEGEYIEPVMYTKIENKKGEVLIQNTSKKEEVIDPGVAFIMTDILRTTVTNGIAGAAATGNQPVGGKTGTTTDNYDAWFCGFTPQYSAALWIGNDVNIELSTGSGAAAALWSRIMRNACEGMGGSFPGAPGNVISSSASGKSEYYINGTQDGVKPLPEEVEIKVCKKTGYKATPWCSETEKKKMMDDDVKAEYYCNEHNIDPEKYPIDPDKKLNKDFVWVEPAKPEEDDTVTDPAVVPPEETTPTPPPAP